MAEKVKFFVNGQKVVVVPEACKIKYFNDDGSVDVENYFGDEKVVFFDDDGNKIVCCPNGKVKVKTSDDDDDDE